MKLLLHICCAPCSIYPLEQLRAAQHAVTGFFYAHNIHPYTEYQRRRQALENYAPTVDLKVIYQKSYDLEEFLRQMVFRESRRCAICYHARLLATAQIARRGLFDAFSSTLLYSTFQQHDTLRELGEAVSREVGIPFYYQDFRRGWQEGVTASRRLGMYRQPYCGCIYSEKDRFYRPARSSPPLQDVPECSAT